MEKISWTDQESMSRGISYMK